MIEWDLPSYRKITLLTKVLLGVSPEKVVGSYLNNAFVLVN